MPHPSPENDSKMKVLLFLALVGAALSQYGQQQDPGYAPPATGGGYPGTYFPFPHHHHHHHSSSSGSHHHSHSRSRSSSSSSSGSSSSSSSSESHEHHNKCKPCKKISPYKGPAIDGLTDANVRYINSNKNGGCKNAIISCPFDTSTYLMYAAVGNDKSTFKKLSFGQFIEREVECVKGKWQGQTVSSGEYTFTTTACVRTKVVAPADVPEIEVVPPPGIALP